VAARRVMAMWLTACGQSTGESDGETGAHGRTRAGALEEGDEGSDALRGIPWAHRSSKRLIP
jgi:hypothetical protein